jgi:hypothetical protein
MEAPPFYVRAYHTNNPAKNQPFSAGKSKKFAFSFLWDKLRAQKW